jgi:hypothetical protein
MSKRATILAAACIVLLAFVPVHAQEFSLYFDAAHIVGSGSSVLVHRVPVVNLATGEVTLYNVTADFAVAADGSLTVTNVSFVLSPFPQHSADNFIPGTYKDSAGNTYIVSVGGVTVDGRAVGGVRSDTAGVTFNATWMSGPVAGHPLIGTLAIAAELLEGPNYGIVGENNVSGFCVGRVIGVEQTGTSILVTAYHSAELGNGLCSVATDGNPNTSFGLATLTLTHVGSSLLPPPPPPQ